MSLQGFVGPFTGDTSGVGAGTSGGGSVSVVSGIGGSTAAYSLSKTTTGTAQINGRTVNSAGASTNMNVASLRWAARVRIDTSPTSGPAMLCRADQGSLSAQVYALQVNVGNTISVQRADGTVVATSSTALTSGDYFVEFYAAVGTSGAYDLRIGGSSEASGTADFGTVNIARIYMGPAVSLTSQSFGVTIAVPSWWDDNSFIGPYTGVRMDINGQGSQTGWTGDYTDVDEVLTEGTFRLTSSAAAAESVTHASCATAGVSGTIHAAKVMSILYETTSGSSSLKTGWRIGAGDYLTSAVNASTAPTLFTYQSVVDPSTSSAWTTTGLDAAEAQVTTGNTVAVACDTIWVGVLFTAAGGPPPVEGSVAAEAPQATGDAAGSLTIGGSGAGVAPNADGSSAGGLTIGGSAAAEAAPAGASSVGALTITGSVAAVAPQADGLAISGVPPVVGSVAADAPQATGSAAGGVSIPGSVASVGSVSSADASGALEIAGVGVASGPAAEALAVGGFVFTGSVAAIAPDATALAVSGDGAAIEILVSAPLTLRTSVAVDAQRLGESVEKPLRISMEVVIPLRV